MSERDTTPRYFYRTALATIGIAAGALGVSSCGLEEGVRNSFDEYFAPPQETLAPLSTEVYVPPTTTTTPVETTTTTTTLAPPIDTTPPTVPNFIIEFEGQVLSCVVGLSEVRQGDVPTTFIADRNGIDRARGFGTVVLNHISVTAPDTFPALVGLSAFNPGELVAFPYCQ